MAKVDTKVIAMDMDRCVVRDRILQRQLDVHQMSDWVNWLADWQVISHLTFRWECSLDSGRRVYERFMRRHLARCSYFYALEENPSRDGFHVHALWADAGSVFRREAWSAWFTRYGRARIEPVRGQGDVSSYCAKYVCKERAWWNVHLQWHRIHKGEFRLTCDGPLRLPDPLPAGGGDRHDQVDQVEPCPTVSAAWVKYGRAV